VFSGIQPSGDLHLGNHLGALVNWVRMQDTHDATYCVVDLHAVTDGHDPAELRRRTMEISTLLLAAGIDPERSTLFVQSHAPEHAQAAWLFNCITGVGELNRMPQFREKSDRATGRGDQVTAGLMTYPVLQTVDIVLHDADEVPVGEDQRHHIELARDLAQRFNHRFASEDDPVFVLPRAIHPAAAARVMDLQDPTNKMSKSTSSDKGIVYVLDDPKRIAKKIRSAVTDSEAEVRHDRATKAGVSNLLEINAAATGRTIDQAEAAYAGGQYGPLKVETAEAVVELLRPVRERYEELAADPGEVARLLAAGADKARARASSTLSRAFDAMGFLPPAGTA
jgi:tryptophanyl-tRNA synthetase